MAAPQNFVPPRVKPSRPKKRFTVEEANRTLPLVSRVASDITREHQKVVAIQEQLQQLSASSKHRSQIEKDLESNMERLASLVNELGNIGCEIKDFQIGLIDFIGKHKGRDVCLCWKLGETDIGYWHEMDAGFTGRQPINTLDERE